jgi:nicotinic acid mononucleotide adenylyltransferase
MSKEKVWGQENQDYIGEKAAELSRRLSDPAFLEHTGLAAARLREFAGRDWWEQVLPQVLPIEGRVRCADILEICRGPMANIAHEPVGGWLSYAYQYATALLYPDEEFLESSDYAQPAARFFLEVLQFVLDEERKVIPHERFMDFDFLQPAEYEKFESREEYRRFLKIFRSEYIYELMRIGMEVTPWTTLEHISGVHWVAMHVARGLYDAGVPIDLALESGAAAGHDLGKFGCKPGEAVPHMHYYYTDQWFRNRGMDYIGYIAANHSTWDLEPERLSVEELVLIYADFRVKQKDGHTIISTLADAFANILNKLENVDRAKYDRYRFVYSRLKDFEDYMCMLGVDINLDGTTVRPDPMPYTTLRTPQQSVQSLVYMGVENNIAIMHRLSARRQFGSFLEAAAGTQNPHELRVYLNLFDLFTAYTNDRQKRQTLDLLYELLMNADGDVRLEAARLIGKIIAQFNFGYRKRFPAGLENTEVWQSKQLLRGMISSILSPGVQVADEARSRIRTNLKNVYAGLLRYCVPTDRADYLNIIMEPYADYSQWDARQRFVLLNALEDVPFDELSQDQLDQVGAFIDDSLNSREVSACVSAWRGALGFARRYPESGHAVHFAAKASAPLLKDDRIAATHAFNTLYWLRQCTCRTVNGVSGTDIDTETQSDMFLNDLSTATPWIVKACNIELLREQVLAHPDQRALHTAEHLANLLRSSELMAVPRSAGRALLDVFPVLSPDERNEIVVELLRALEAPDTEYSKYAAEYLALTALWLPRAQLEEVLRRLRRLLASHSDSVAAGALDTVGVMLKNSESWHGKRRGGQGPTEELPEDLLSALFAMILKGMASSRAQVRQEALQVCGRVFSSETLTTAVRCRLFNVACRKLLYLMRDEEASDISAFARASATAAVSTFISRYLLDHDSFDIREYGSVAFFPGSFDPFTRSHKEIVREIRDMGYEVYLSVDEFSWSKKTQPHLVRRNIISMAVADEFHVSIFPHEVQINIANPSDLKALVECFPGREVYMVVGSDVVANASSYKKPPEPWSIHGMNHIVFRRVGDSHSDSLFNRDMLQSITGKVVELTLPNEYETISSTLLRENIDRGRDISDLIDPLGQQYIYEHSLYLREPEYKPLAKGRVIHFEATTNPNEHLLQELCDIVMEPYEDGRQVLDRAREEGDRLLVLRNMEMDGKPAGFIRTQIIAPEELYEVLHSVELADRVRRATSGNILLIKGIYSRKDEEVRDPSQLLLAEAIANSFKHGASYALYYPRDGIMSKYSESAVLRQGFVRSGMAEAEGPLFLVDMHEPIVMLRNLQTTIKEPMASDPAVVRMLERTHRSLQQALCRLYPGQLVLSLSSVVIYPRLVEKVCRANQVPMTPTVPRKLGPAMCVPFGKILRDRVMPNTVTKTLHTDKVFDPSLNRWWIEAFANYMPLENQIRMIRSFNRPIILVDDILDNCNRFSTLEPILRREQVDIRKMVLGVLTGRGRDLMAVRGIDADSVYYIPNVRRWLVESTLYPFVGGDTVERRAFSGVPVLQPSVNPVLPYTDPHWEGAADEAAFEYSACCVRNARELFLTLEESYRAHYGRSLTLTRLPEVVVVPSAPDRGECVEYEPGLAATVYLDNDLKMLYRMK